MQRKRPLEIQLTDEQRDRWDAAAGTRPTVSWVIDLVEAAIKAKPAKRRPSKRAPGRAMSEEEARFKGPDFKTGGKP